MAGLSGQPWANLRVVVIGLIVLTGLFVAGAGVLSWFDCNGGRSCPANGCNSAAIQQACQDGQAFAFESVGVGIPLAFVALGVVVWSMRREGRLPSRLPA